jgi:nitrogen regulatory protein PII
MAQRLLRVRIKKIPGQESIQNCRRRQLHEKKSNGKIFISELEEAVRIRTGEAGIDAI